MKLAFKDFSKAGSIFYMADLVLINGDYTMGHDHDFYEFFVVMEGAFWHECDGEKTLMTKGMYKFLKPESFHRQFASSDYSRNRIRNIALEKDYFESFIKAHGFEREQALWEYGSLIQLGLDQFSYKTEKLNQLTRRDLAEYRAENIMMDLVLERLGEEKPLRAVPHWLEEACKGLVEEGVHKENALEWLVKTCGKSQEHVTRACKEHYGLTPTEWINRERLEEGVKQLVTTKLPIIEIAYQCGFNNMAYFNRRFKEKYHCTPTEYRKRHYKTFY